MEPIIEVKNLSVIYNLGKSNEAVALDDVNLEIYPGEYVVFFGPSGCGKSTLLYCLAGLLTPTKGEIIVYRDKLSDLSPKEMVLYRRMVVGMIFQAYNLIPTLTVLDNVLLPHIFGGLNLKESIKKAKLLLQRFGIENLANRYPFELSGGQQQRVAIARALMYDPPILLADEPVGNLDSASAKVVMDTLKEINEKMGKTIVLVTHEASYLEDAHRVFHMKDGKIIRVVINEKKKQIGPFEGKRVIQKVLPKEKPVLHPSSLALYLLTSFDEAVIRRLEEAIRKRISGEIDAQQFKEILDRPFEKGGVGLYRQTAESFAQKIERILAESEALKEVLPEKPVEEIQKKVERLRKFILEGWKGSLKTEEQLKRLDEAILLRLEKKIGKKEFQRLLDLPLKKGGVGLDRRTARNFARKLEVALIHEF
jgi:putative ABC transport system ATP-binding protein